jgi:hypothetical protein
VQLSGSTKPWVRTQGDTEAVRLRSTGWGTGGDGAKWRECGLCPVVLVPFSKKLIFLGNLGYLCENLVFQCLQVGQTFFFFLHDKLNKSRPLGDTCVGPLLS